MQKYTAQVGPDNAKRLATEAGPDGVAVVENIGEGTVRINDIDQVRLRGTDDDGYVTEDEDGLQIWIDDEGYPLFDAAGETVAEALGAQTHYLEAKRQADYAQGVYATAVAAVVAEAGSAEEAAKLLGTDASAITELLAVPE